jgi:hypothetical protein
VQAQQPDVLAQRFILVVIRHGYSPLGLHKTKVYNSGWQDAICVNARRSHPAMRETGNAAR